MSAVTAETAPVRPDLLAGVRDRCLALPEATEHVSPTGPAWRERGRRAFGRYVECYRFDPHIVLWLAAPPGELEETVRADPVHYFRPPFFERRGWIGYRLDVDDGGPDWAEVRELIDQAYRRVSPRFLTARLDDRRAGR